MSLKPVRIARLKKLQADKKLLGLAEFGQLIGRKVNQVSDLLAGRASFGEKVARSIEEKAGLPNGWLDESVKDGWPFDSIDQERYDNLTAEQQRVIESAVAGMVQGFEQVNKGTASGGGSTNYPEDKARYGT